MIKCTKYCYSEMPLTRRAHKSKETGVPRKMHLRIRLRAHLTVTQRKVNPGQHHVGSADPMVRPNLDCNMSRCTLERSSP